MMMKQLFGSLLTVAVLSSLAIPAFAKNYSPAECPVVGNKNSKIYHDANSGHYTAMLKENSGTDNRVCFKTVAAARAAGYSNTAVGETKKVVKETKTAVKTAGKKVAEETKTVARRTKAETKEVAQDVKSGTKKAAKKVKETGKKVVHTTEKGVEKVATKTAKKMDKLQKN